MTGDNTVPLQKESPGKDSTEFRASTVSIAAADLLEALKPFEGQQALYLNAIPLVKAAALKAVTDHLSQSRGPWEGYGIKNETMAHARVAQHLKVCEEFYGMTPGKADSWQQSVN